MTDRIDVSDLLAGNYPDIEWLDDVEEHDYAAAENYLSLIVSPERASATVTYGLKTYGVIMHYFAKDIIRAAHIDLLPTDNVHVAKDLVKVKHGHKLSPILLVRHNPLIIVDGYHRVCAAHHVDENAVVPCRIGQLKI